MSAQCDIARLVVHKKALQTELEEVRHEIKTQCQSIELPFAVEIDGYAVTVKPAPYSGATPITSVMKLYCNCDDAES
jgi:hypothetical protein